MSHHYEDPDACRAELAEMRRILGVPDGLGATGRHPRGKLSEADEGEIKIAIAADPKTQTVLIDFGKPIAMIGFSVEQASEIGAMLIDKAMALRGIDPGK